MTLYSRSTKYVNIDWVLLVVRRTAGASWLPGSFPLMYVVFVAISCMRVGASAMTALLTCSDIKFFSVKLE